jgi:anti-sigma B factor antagonist
MSARRRVLTLARHPARAGVPIGLSIHVKPHRESVVIVPAGEIDLATVGLLQAELEELLAAGFARIVIDLRRVEFLDSAGLHALVSAHARAKDEGWQLAIIPGRRAVQRIFEITRTLETLPFTSVADGASMSEVRELGGAPPTA